MNKLRYCLVIVGLTASLLVKAHSKSIFIPRSITTDSVFELALTNYDRYHDDSGACSYFYAKPFYMRSFNKKDLSRYFLPNNRRCVTFDESGAGDLDPLWFNLISPQGSFYRSLVCLCPERQAYGAVLTFYTQFCDDWWFGLNMTPMHVKHNLHVQESGRAEEGTLEGFRNACDAFNNPGWTAGHLSCSSRGKTGLDDIQFKLGYDFYKTCNEHASVYLVGTAPTGSRQESFYLFEPLVGSKNGSVGVGVNTDCEVYACNEHALNFMADFKYRYVFSATQRRSFDLRNNGDWSRYLLIVTPNEPLNSLPGINLFTQQVKVSPRNTVDLWLAAHYAYCGFNFEFGYDFWWRQEEKVCRKCPLRSDFGIQTLALCSLPITSASTANISQTAVGDNATRTDSSFVELTGADLDISSGTHPSSHSSTLYAALSYNDSICDYPVMLGLGGSCEFATKNALEQWAVWFSAGVGF